MWEGITVMKLTRLSFLLLTSLLATSLWAQDFETWDFEVESGPHPFFNCSQFDGMDFWIWSDYTYREQGTAWLDPVYQDGRPSQLAFQGSIHDPELWVPRDANCHIPAYFGECESDSVLRGMKMKLLPPFESWWETWGDWIDAGPPVGWVPTWISRSGVFFVLNTPDSPSGKLNIRYEGSYLMGINPSAPGVEPLKPAGEWGIEWLSPGFAPPFNPSDGSFSNTDDLHAICEAIMHGEGAP
jgi:hypothetical protein